MSHTHFSLSSPHVVAFSPPLCVAFLCEEMSTLLRRHFAEVHKLDHIHVVRPSWNVTKGEYSCDDIPTTPGFGFKGVSETGLRQDQDDTPLVCWIIHPDKHSYPNSADLDFPHFYLFILGR